MIHECSRPPLLNRRENPEFAVCVCEGEMKTEKIYRQRCEGLEEECKMTKNDAKSAGWWEE